MVENRCYDADCADENCHNPEHFNYICLDPKCDEIHCENPDHYDRQLLRDYQEKTDLSIHDHSEKIDYDEDVDISLCGCPDCADDDGHEHSHEHEHHHDHDHEDVCTDDDCGCHDYEHDHDDVEFSLCGCPDCADDDDHGHDHGHEHSHGDEELLAEGKPLIANRPIQIIVASGILFVLGHVFEWLSFDPTIVTVTYMLGAVIAGYEIAIMAYKSLVNRHTIGPAMLMCIACVASFIIGHPEEGAAVTFLYYIAEFLEDYAEHRAKRSIKALVEIAPDTARVKVGDKEEIRNVDEVNIGDIVIVKPGDKVPLDGEVILGSSSINQASITGESVPVLKEVGDNVFSGTVNEDGYLEIKVTSEAKDSVISKIVTLVKR